MHYTPTLQVIRMCINERERYLQEPREVGFWSYILVEYNPANDLHAVDVCSRVNTMVKKRKRKQVIADLHRASGVAVSADTNLD